MLSSRGTLTMAIFDGTDWQYVVLGPIHSQLIGNAFDASILDALAHAITACTRLQVLSFNSLSFMSSPAAVIAIANHPSLSAVL